MNLHYETVSPLLKETLQKLVNSPIFKGFFHPQNGMTILEGINLVIYS